MAKARAPARHIGRQDKFSRTSSQAFIAVPLICRHALLRSSAALASILPLLSSTRTICHFVAAFRNLKQQRSAALWQIWHIAFCMTRTRKAGSDLTSRLCARHA